MGVRTFTRSDEICPEPRYMHSHNGHGVHTENRSNPRGAEFNSSYDNYQQGDCDSCGELVYSERDDIVNQFHPWRARWGYIIHEVPW